MNEKNSNISHELKIIDRSLLTLSGINRIVSFDSFEFVLESNMGPVHIKGEGLELLSLDMQDNTIRIKGKISGYNYIDKVSKKKEESIISKLFK